MNRDTTLLGVWAHPDDESYLSAALMRRVVAAGGRVALITATRGEHGTDDPDVDHDELGRQREAELRAAMAHLGVWDVSVLGLPDGGCEQIDPFDPGGPVAAITRAMTSLRPNVVVTFGPEGITEHPDHVAVGRWTTAAWLAAHGSPGTLPPDRRLLYAAMTHDFVQRHERDLPGIPLTLTGTPPTSIGEDEVAVRIEPTRDELTRKRAALTAHRSQTEPLIELLGAPRFHAWWTSEVFRSPTAAEISTSPHRLHTDSKQLRRRAVTVGT